MTYQKNKLIVVFSTVLMTLLCSYFAGAHPMTERYIPIGQSPGVSGKYSAIGVVRGIDHDTRSITIENESGQHTYAMDKKTRIWVDRTNWKLTNLKGSYQDCEVGRRVEVMHRKGTDHAAEWIKVEAMEAK